MHSSAARSYELSAEIESRAGPEMEMCCPSTKRAIKMTVHDLIDARVNLL